MAVICPRWTWEGISVEYSLNFFGLAGKIKSFVFAGGGWIEEYSFELILLVKGVGNVIKIIIQFRQELYF